MNESNVASLLDATLNDLADLPSFKPFPAGAHKVKIKWAVKEIKNSPAVELEMTAVETVELNDQADEPLKAGDSTGVLFQLNSEFGQGKLKEILRVLTPAFGGNSMRETMDASNGAEVLVVTKIRTNKTDATQKYTDIVSLSVV